jgi:hypothetical protein
MCIIYDQCIRVMHLNIWQMILMVMAMEITKLNHKMWSNNRQNEIYSKGNRYNNTPLNIHPSKCETNWKLHHSSLSQKFQCEFQCPRTNTWWRRWTFLINSYLSFSHIMLKPLRTTKFTTYSSLKTPTSLFGKTKTHTHTHTHTFISVGFLGFFSWLNFYSKWLKIRVLFISQFCSRQNLRIFLGLIARFVYWDLTLVAKNVKDWFFIDFNFQIY